MWNDAFQQFCLGRKFIRGTDTQSAQWKVYIAFLQERNGFLLQINNIMVLLEYLARCSIDEHLLHEEILTRAIIGCEAVS